MYSFTDGNAEPSTSQVLEVSVNETDGILSPWCQSPKAPNQQSTLTCQASGIDFDLPILKIQQLRLSEGLRSQEECIALKT